LKNEKSPGTPGDFLKSDGRIQEKFGGYFTLFIVLMHRVQIDRFLPSNFLLWTLILNFLFVAMLE